MLPSEISQLLLDSALIIYEQQMKPQPKRRSTGSSSVSSERSIDGEQSDEDVLDAIAGGQQTTNVIKHQPKISNALPSISANIPTFLDINRDLSKELNRKIDREISKLHLRSPNLIENKRLMRELMFDSEFGLNNLKETKLDIAAKLVPSGDLSSSSFII